MHTYRIAKKKYIHDISGEGARMFGGRWNKKGTSVLYTAENRSLATAEYLVHISMGILPHDSCIAEFFIPDEINYEQIKVTDLPTYWSTYPAPLLLTEIGEKWIKNNNTLLLKVPSSVVKNEWNFLINPKHELFSKVKITGIELYNFDERLMKE